MGELLPFGVDDLNVQPTAPHFMPVEGAPLGFGTADSTEIVESGQAANLSSPPKAAEDGTTGEAVDLS